MIKVKELSISVGSERKTVLKHCSLTVATGERAALTGPSGCGTTTLLRCIAGLIKPDAGSVIVKGRISVVFQEPRLFPWLTAAQNLDVVLPSKKPGAATSSVAITWVVATGSLCW